MPRKREAPAPSDAAGSQKKARARSPEPSEELKARVRALLEGANPLASGIPDFLCCPITGVLLANPVVAQDGFTYERDGIETWFGIKKTSPTTNLPISDHLTANQNIKSTIDAYVTERARELRRSEQHAGAGPPDLDAAVPEAVKSLAELAGMFSKLDGMRDLLAETLQDWGPSKIVVVGSESSGKSSVLERLMMMPLLPRDEVSHSQRPQINPLPSVPTHANPMTNLTLDTSTLRVSLSPKTLVVCSQCCFCTTPTL